MNKWIEELKQLDPKNPGNWPWPFKAGGLLLLFLAVLAAGWFGLFSVQLEELDKEKRKEAELKNTFLEKKKLAVNLEAYQQQRAEIEQSFGVLLKSLPTKSEIEALIIDINQAGLGRGLQFELFKPAQNENITEFYAEKPVDLKVTGNYHDLGAFASDVSKLPRIVLLHDLKIENVKDGLLSMEAKAKTYRYLDPEEIAAQRKTAKSAAKPGGK
ncbi:MAG: type 4a pilus biogenesis protein PilO [Rhodocyclaceae bacterium]|jgi:type IV pilus assembly protein PilO|nr:type 4a pilus biogenesis protein PilO [Rhodocyclaceae bacterium]MCA3021741.1 type 4a pilus biogenesis protein PilO [Rhodocyclaceae bacterium]MCA3023961.1 type 4a pilus biogenesis protein PilO [Rhodocyclaceae bacterium]MCA3027817.1 type 4a pilus biogenesis protein PilO [Rhodocyclaceae bacterium]MCA3030747.1 type 4a pilus biogenesis protein PilO [Rhodocyclaceae bacterium]